MTKSELTKKLAQKFQLHLTQARSIVDIIFQSMSDSLRDGDRIEIRGFGSFFVKDYKERTSRNPRTGEIITVAPKRGLGFRAGKALREKVNGE